MGWLWRKRWIDRKMVWAGAMRDLAYEMSKVFEVPLLRCCEMIMTMNWSDRGRWGCEGCIYIAM